MHILGLMIAVLAGAAFWYYRMRMIGRAGSEVIDHAGRLRGQLRRNAMRRKVEESPVMAIDDPVVAAASLLCMLAATVHPLTPREEGAVRGWLATVLDDPDSAASRAQLDEAIVYGRWLHRQGLDAPKGIRMLCEKLNGWLTTAELRDVVNMVEGLHASDDIVLSKPRVEQALRRLRA